MYEHYPFIRDNDGLTEFYEFSNRKRKQCDFYPNNLILIPIYNVTVY